MSTTGNSQPRCLLKTQKDCGGTWQLTTPPSTSSLYFALDDSIAHQRKNLTKLLVIQICLQNLGIQILPKKQEKLKQESSINPKFTVQPTNFFPFKSLYKKIHVTLHIWVGWKAFQRQKMAWCEHFVLLTFFSFKQAKGI